MASVNIGPGRAPVVPLILTLTGAYLCWFAIHYWARGGWPTEPVKSVLTGGGVPARGQSSIITTAQLTADVQTAAGTAPAGSSGSSGTSGSSGSSGSSTGSGIADAALKYAGQGYVWGGPADVPGDWDCSSFVSYVLGHDLGMTLPGGGRYGDPGYPPNTHGPTTLTYLLFGTPVNFGSEQAGDLVVSTEHMGIVTGPGTMISAQDPQLGTGTGNYPAGFPAGPPVYRRVT